MGYLIGVDGGATKTAAILAAEDGTILHRAVGPASNYHAVGIEKASEALHQVIGEVVAGAQESLDNNIMTVFGLSGLNNDVDQEIYETMIAKIGLGGQVRVENDIVVAWAAATACKPGVVVIAGTGSSAYGVNAEGKAVKTLGWDYILADQGSGYWVGLNGLQDSIKYWDGRLVDEGQLLYEAMLSHYKVKDAETALELIYSDDFLEDMKTEIASFSRKVSECAQKGDTAAQKILQRAGKELGESVCAVIRRLDMAEQEMVVGLIGSTFHSGAFLQDAFDACVLKLAPKAHIETAQFRAQVGSLIFGYNRLGMLTHELLEKLPNRDELD